MIILKQIFARLDVRRLTLCRGVCRRWAALVDRLLDGDQDHDNEIYIIYGKMVGDHVQYSERTYLSFCVCYKTGECWWTGWTL